MTIVDRYPVIIFDLFHTLTSLESVKAPGHRTVSVLGIPREVWNTQLFEHSLDRLTGRIKDPVAIIASLAHEIDPSIPQGIIEKAAYARKARFRYALIHPDQDTLSTLQELRRRKKKLGLISNADTMEKDGWEDSPLKVYFDYAAFSCDVGIMKPDHAIYRLCMERLHVQPKDCLYAGDGSHGELKSAQELGMTTVLVTHVVKNLWPERIQSARPFAHYEVERLSEMLHLS